MKVVEIGELYFDGSTIRITGWRFDAEGGSIDADKLAPTILKYLLRHKFKIAFTSNEVIP